MTLKDRIRRSAYVTGSAFPPLWKALLGLPLVAMCKANGWKRDMHGRIYRVVRDTDPPSALFFGQTAIWFDERAPGGERVMTWSYRNAWLFDIGALGSFIPSETHDA